METDITAGDSASETAADTTRVRPRTVSGAITSAITSVKPASRHVRANALTGAATTSRIRGPIAFARPLHMRPRLIEKYSYGIACTRFNGRIPQILLVQRRITYAFNAFVYGLYDPANTASIMQLINHMTVAEKILLRRRDFRQLWMHIWVNGGASESASSGTGAGKTDTNKYRYLEDRFNSIFCDGTNKLIDCLARSADSGYLLWEMPKGRRRDREPDIHAAIREFYEETGIEKRQYFLYPLATQTSTFIDGDVRYTHKYYIARADGGAVTPRIRLAGDSQIEEICDIAWMSLEDIRVVDKCGRLARMVRPIFNFVRKNTTRL